MAVVLEGRCVVKTIRKMHGATNPQDADVGTIRGDFGIDTGRNLVHGSDSVESAKREIAIWFPEAKPSPIESSMKHFIYEL